MLKIKFNQDLFDKHISKIFNKIIPKLSKKKILSYKLNADEINCLKYVGDNLKDILSSNVSKLKGYMFYFQLKYPNSLGIEGQKKENWNPLYKILRDDIFENEYNNWGGRTVEYNAYEFVSTLDLKTCPYCNRNYTFIVDEKSGKLRPEIDHFYPKSKYPFLAMSFYNLIPSCPICNHTKSNKDRLDLINPYNVKENDFKFSIIPNNIDFFNVENKKYNFNSFELELNGNKSNIEVFKLEELYKQHKDIVLDILIKKAYYPKSYVEELQRFGFGSDEIYRYLFSNYKKDEDLHKRPLSKLIKDISKELNLI